MLKNVRDKNVSTDTQTVAVYRSCSRT